MKILHNPRCRKSRETLQVLHDNGAVPEVVLYLIDVPKFEELSHIISLLKITPFQLIRKSETIYKEQFKGKNLTDEQWIQAMIENPKLIERPIVIKGNVAVLGRPPSNVLTLF